MQRYFVQPGAVILRKVRISGKDVEQIDIITHVTYGIEGEANTLTLLRGGMRTHQEHEGYQLLGLMGFTSSDLKLGSQISY